MRRDSGYFIERLARDGRHDLLAKIETGDLSVYSASIEAGLRHRNRTTSRSEHLSYHWARTSEAEKLRFLLRNIKSIAPMVVRILKQLNATKKDASPLG